MIALSEMETRSIDHQTRLFMSMDTPHRGAVVPESVVRMANEFTRTQLWGFINGRDLAQQGLNLLESTCTNQLMMNNPDPNRAQIFDDFQNWYQSLPRPVNCDIVAISNGAGNCAVPNTIGTNEDLFRVNKDEGIVQTFFSGSSGLERFGLWILPFMYSQVRLESFAKTQFSSGSSYKLDADFMLDMGFFHIPFNIVDIEGNTSSSIPYESLPGGNFDAGNLGTVNIPNWGNVALEITNKSICFVPVTSALNVASTSSGDYYRRFIPEQTMPGDFIFDNFVTRGSTNTAHINYYNETINTTFILAQLNTPFGATGPQLRCSHECTGLNYVGPTFDIPANVCGSSTIDINSGAGFDIDFINNNEFSFGSAGPSSVSVSTNPGISSGTHDFDIEIQDINQACQIRILKKYANVGGATQPGYIYYGQSNSGIPPYSGLFLDGSTICPNKSTLFSTSYTPDTGILEYQWMIPAGVSSYTGPTDQYNIVFNGSSYTGNTGVSVRRRNACGWSNWRTAYYAVENDFYDCEYLLFRVSPNPSSDFVEVSGYENDMDSNEDFSVEFYGTDGTLFDTFNSTHGKLRINTRKYNQGHYLLRIVKDGQEKDIKRILITD